MKPSEIIKTWEQYPWSLLLKFTIKQICCLVSVIAIKNHDSLTPESINMEIMRLAAGLFFCCTAVFTARCICIARTMPWQDVCLSVHPSHASILSRWLYISSKIFRHRIAPPFYFFHTKRDGNTPIGTSLTRTTNARGYEKITIFDQYLYLGNDAR